MQEQTAEVLGTGEYEPLTPDHRGNFHPAADNTAEVDPRNAAERRAFLNGPTWAGASERRESGVTSWDFEEPLPELKPRLCLRPAAPGEVEPSRRPIRVGTMALLKWELLSLIDDNPVVGAFNRLAAASPAQIAVGLARTLAVAVAVVALLLGANYVITRSGENERAATSTTEGSPSTPGHAVVIDFDNLVTDEDVVASATPAGDTVKPAKRSKRTRQVKKRHKRGGSKKKKHKRRSSRRRR